MNMTPSGNCFDLGFGATHVETLKGVSGLGDPADAEEGGGLNRHVWNIPSANKSGEIVLTRGADKSPQFSDWIKKASSGASASWCTSIPCTRITTSPRGTSCRPAGGRRPAVPVRPARGPGRRRDRVRRGRHRAWLPRPGIIRGTASALDTFLMGWIIWWIQQH